MPIELKKPPEFCQYSDGPCDQIFDGVTPSRGLFLYPSKPEQIAATIEAGVQKMRSTQSGRWLTWKDLGTTGQIIFCAICKNTRFSNCIIADVTTLNFNLLFEIGFALGLELPIVPIRDTTFIRDKREFEELGLLDTIGYLDFQNSDDLATRLTARLPFEAIPEPPSDLKKDSPLYVLKGPINTEGAVRLMSTLKKSGLRFRTYDILETPRLSLHEARKQVGSSLGVVAHLLSPEREGHRVHNARCALIAGLAMSSGRTVLLLQEGNVSQPIDYRDVVSTYTNPDQVPKILEQLILGVVNRLQDSTIKAIKRPERLLEQLDIGDVAAENEIRPLRSYFLRTGQYNEAKRGHARLVIGRKGSGKTAIFYAIRDSFLNRRSHLILDLKPEGHQFVKLREVILSQLSPGLQGHTLTAFWNSILLSEIAHKIYQTERAWAQSDYDRHNRFRRLCEVYLDQGLAETGDLSERLLRQVDRIAERYRDFTGITTTGQITNLLFTGDIKELNAAVADYLKEKQEVWLLFDNLDKGWPTRGAKSEDILIIRTLLEATRKLQRQLEDLGIEFRCLVFLRNDIHDLLVLETPDKGKDTAITLDWDDIEAFKEIIRLRITATTGLTGSFTEIWASIFASHIGAQVSFQYVVDRTLMRPRDLLNYLHRAIEVAVNRGHDRVSQDDLIKAEGIYSEDIFLATAFELKDVYPAATDFLYVFLRCPVQLSKDRIFELLASAGFAEKNREDALKLLVWFGFLGIEDLSTGEPRFAYQMRHDINKLLTPLATTTPRFIIHPAFRKALECVETTP